MFRSRLGLLAVFASLAIAMPLLVEADAAPARVAVGPQYGSAHVYVAPDQVDRLVESLVATFGGHASPASVITATPVPSSAISRLVSTPAGLFSVFGFNTPLPYPFGDERTGYLVTNMDTAIAAARHDGASLVVSPFADAIGRDAIIRWPGGVMMQLYWHNKAPSYRPLQSTPENRVYISSDDVDAFIHDFTAFSDGRVVGDDARSPGVEVGRPGESFRCVRVGSPFGNVRILVTDGHLPWPYGREISGYAVADLAKTLAKAKKAGVEVLAGPFETDGRGMAMVRFPGGYIAEMHTLKPE
jgi:hypothetical protein